MVSKSGDIENSYSGGGPGCKLGAPCRPKKGRKGSTKRTGKKENEGPCRAPETGEDRTGQKQNDKCRLRERKERAPALPNVGEVVMERRAAKTRIEGQRARNNPAPRGKEVGERRQRITLLGPGTLKGHLGTKQIIMRKNRM